MAARRRSTTHHPQNPSLSIIDAYRCQRCRGAARFGHHRRHNHQNRGASWCISPTLHKTPSSAAGMGCAGASAASDALDRFYSGRRWRGRPGDCMQQRKNGRYAGEKYFAIIVDQPRAATTNSSLDNQPPNLSGMLSDDLLLCYRSWGHSKKTTINQKRGGFANHDFMCAACVGLLQ